MTQQVTTFVDHHDFGVGFRYEGRFKIQMVKGLSHSILASKMRLVLILAVPLLLMSAGAALAGPSADYGDAPDNATFKFPSLYNTTNAAAGRRGPFHLNVSQEWIGVSPISSTTAETDALVSDLDADDANIVGSPILGVLAGGQGYFAIPVTVAGSAPSLTRYLNVLIDQNLDNKWDSAPALVNEWVARNREVRTPPGQTNYIVHGSFTINPAILSTATRVRITLTREKINEDAFGASGWDGSGPDSGWAYGETEDWLITGVNPAGGGGGGGVLKLLKVEMIPSVVYTPFAPNWRTFTVRVKNVGTSDPASFDPANPLGFNVTISVREVNHTGVDEHVTLRDMNPLGPAGAGSTNHGFGDPNGGTLDGGNVLTTRARVAALPNRTTDFIDFQSQFPGIDRRPRVCYARWTLTYDPDGYIYVHDYDSQIAGETVGYTAVGFYSWAIAAVMLAGVGLLMKKRGLSRRGVANGWEQ